MTGADNDGDSYMDPLGDVVDGDEKILPAPSLCGNGGSGQRRAGRVRGTGEEPPEKKGHLENGNAKRLIIVVHRDWTGIVWYGSIRLNTHHNVV